MDGLLKVSPALQPVRYFRLSGGVLVTVFSVTLHFDAGSKMLAQHSHLFMSWFNLRWNSHSQYEECTQN